MRVVWRWLFGEGCLEVVKSMFCASLIVTFFHVVFSISLQCYLIITKG